MKDSYSKKLWFCFKWQIRPVCVFTEWKRNAKEVLEVFSCLISAIGIIIFNVLLFPFILAWAIVYPFYHIVVYPFKFAFKAEDGLIEKLLKRNETLKKELEKQEAMKSDEEADPMFYQDGDDS